MSINFLQEAQRAHHRRLVRQRRRKERKKQRKKKLNKLKKMASGAIGKDSGASGPTFTRSRKASEAMDTLMAGSSPDKGPENGGSKQPGDSGRSSVHVGQGSSGTDKPAPVTVQGLAVSPEAPGQEDVQEEDEEPAQEKEAASTSDKVAQGSSLLEEGLSVSVGLEPSDSPRTEQTAPATPGLALGDKPFCFPPHREGTGFGGAESKDRDTVGAEGKDEATTGEAQEVGGTSRQGSTVASVAKEEADGFHEGEDGNLKGGKEEEEEGGESSEHDEDSEESDSEEESAGSGRGVVDKEKLDSTKVMALLEECVWSHVFPIVLGWYRRKYKEQEQEVLYSRKMLRATLTLEFLGLDPFFRLGEALDPLLATSQGILPPRFDLEARHSIAVGSSPSGAKISSAAGASAVAMATSAREEKKDSGMVKLPQVKVQEHPLQPATDLPFPYILSIESFHALSKPQVSRFFESGQRIESFVNSCVTLSSPILVLQSRSHPPFFITFSPSSSSCKAPHQLLEAAGKVLESMQKEIKSFWEARPAVSKMTRIT